MRKSLVLLIVLLTFALCGFQNNKNRDIIKFSSGEQVIKAFIKARNEKNLSKLEQTLIEANKGVDWKLKNIKYIYIIRMKEKTSKKLINDYLTYGGGRITHPYDVKVFAVYYKIKYIDVSTEPDPTEGVCGKSFTLIKENKKSNWLIADWGC
jgi:hypothetical protein